MARILLHILGGCSEAYGLSWRPVHHSQTSFASAQALPHQHVGRWASAIPSRHSLTAAAAAVILALLAPAVEVRLQADALAETGEVRTIKLSDGSTTLIALSLQSAQA